MKNYLINERIHAAQVRVIDVDGGQLGVMPKDQALNTAKEKGYDLVLVSTGVEPPVCKIADFGKMKYEMLKSEKEARKKQKAGTLKDLKLSTKIGEHDYQVVLNKSLEFLGKGHKVRVTLRFKGREVTHSGLGLNVMKRLIDNVAAAGTVESPPKLEGKTYFMTIAPKSQ